MKYNLDSATVIVLRDVIKWESSLVSYSGTLTPVDFTGPIEPLSYQKRDRELAFRDLINASAIVETSVQVSDVWNYAAPMPKLQGPVAANMPDVSRNEFYFQNGNTSQIRHVQNVSLAVDAARYADADLYGRDCLIYETLARAGTDAFTHPPLRSIDSQGTIFSDGSYAWSLGEGTIAQADISSSLPLSLDTFKRPDQNLADRDNQLAGYAAHLAQILKNPFAYALRLYVQIDATTTVNQRESEVYTLTSEDATERVWTCEPALSNRNKIVYNIPNQTLQWFRETDTGLHQPQLVAMTVPGIVAGQTITTLPSIPDGKDCQYWRSKAAQIKPTGVEIVDTNDDLTFTSSRAVAAGGVLQPDCASLTVPGNITFTLPTGLAANKTYRVSMLVQPDPRVEIMGNQNTSNTGGTLGAVDYGINYAASPSTLPAIAQYLVVGGDGITYNSINYTAGQVFTGLDTTPLLGYTPYLTVPSTVNQYSVGFRIALPPGPWTVEMGYTNRSGSTTGFGIRSQIVPQGQTAVEVFSDLVPTPFTGSNGDINTIAPVAFDVPFIAGAGIPTFDFPVYWTYGDGQLSIQNMVFTSTMPVTSAGSYAMEATLATSKSSAFVTAERKLPEVIRFDFSTTAPSTGNFSVTWINSATLYEQSIYVPLKIKQVQVQSVGTYTATPMATDFQGWRQECLDRAESAVQHGFDVAVRAYGTNIPTFAGADGYWGTYQSESWMAFTETANPRLRELASVPQTLGIVTGRQYEVVTGPVTYNYTAYSVGSRFYGIDGQTDYSGGTVKQLGAFLKSKPGHIGKPALMPDGLYFTSYGTAASAYTNKHSVPRIVACQPWMIDAGLYVAQSDFWLPETI